MKPYIGITGFKTTEQIDFAAKEFEKNNAYGMFGFLTSSKRLANKEIEGKQSPAVKQLDFLVSMVPKNQLAMLHYHTQEQGTMVDEVKTLMTNMYQNNLCKAIQLNMPWPQKESIDQLLQTFPELQIVLQLPTRATGDLEPEEIAKKASTYDSLVTYALIDPSGGKGVEFDIQNATTLMNYLHQAMPTTTIGVAGGFSPQNVEARVQEIQKHYAEPFFIDAQGRLRTEDKKSLDKTKVGEYIKAASRCQPLF